MPTKFSLGDAKRLMRKLMALGNFDEFVDSREKDGLNKAAAHEIGDFVRKTVAAMEGGGT